MGTFEAHALKYTATVSSATDAKYIMALAHALDEANARIERLARAAGVVDKTVRAALTSTE